MSGRPPLGGAAPAAVALIAAALTAAYPGGAAAQARAAGADYLYAAVQGEAAVAVVDMASLEVVARVELRELGFTENAKPHHVAVSPDGSRWYLSLIGENRVLAFDGENRLLGSAEFEVPGMLALHPKGEVLFVGRSMSAVNPPARIGAIRTGPDAARMEVEEVDVFFPRPHALALSADGERVYSASLGVNQLAAVDAGSGEMTLIDIPGETHAPVQFAVAPDGRTLVASTQLTGRLLVFDLEDPDHPTLRAEIPLGGQPWHPVYAPAGDVVYVGLKMENRVVAVDVARGAVVWSTEHPGLNHPHGSALSPDGRRLFISSNGPGGMQMGEPAPDAGAGAGHGAHGAGRAATGTVTVLDARDGTVLKVLELGENVTGLGARTR
ncbi:MAG: YncE family protein [Longimicrobiales bacterium]|nr:YncE family protein [Longimicrobiales bacterium]